MSETYTPAATWHETIVTPTGGGPRDALSVSNPLKAVMDNAEYLREQNEVTGVPMVRTVATEAALRALIGTGRANKEVCILSDGITKAAPYVFCASATEAENTPWVYVPNDNTGRWVHINRWQMDLSGSRPRWTNPLQAHSIVYQGNVVANPINVTSTSWIQMEASGAGIEIVTPALEVDDIIDVWAICRVVSDGSLSNVAISVYDSTDHYSPLSGVGTDPTTANINHRHIVTVAGVHKIKWMAKAGSGETMIFAALGTQLRAYVIRPLG